MQHSAISGLQGQLKRPELKPDVLHLECPNGSGGTSQQQKPIFFVRLVMLRTYTSNITNAWICVHLLPASQMKAVWDKVRQTR